MQREEYDWYAEELHSKVEQEAAKLAKLTTQSTNVNAPSATGPIDLDHPRILDLQNLSSGTYAAVQRTMSKNAPDSDTLSTMTTPSSSHQHSPTRPGSVGAAAQRVVQRVSPPMMQGGVQLAHAVGTHIQGVQNVQMQGAATHVYPAGGQLQGAAGRTPGSGEGVKGPGNSMDWVFC